MSASTSPRRAGCWRRRVLIVLVLGPLLFLLGSNLVLDSSWGRERLARKMASMTGFHWTVGSGSWSPWGGVRLKELTASAPVVSGPDPGPVLTIAEVRARPYWTSVLRGKPVVREIVVESPAGDVPLELLAAMGPGRKTAAAQAVRVTPSAPEAPVPEDGEESTPARPGQTAGEPTTPEPGESRPSGEETDDGLAGSVRINNGRLRVYSLQAPDHALEVEGIDLDLPVAGPPAEGSVKFGPLRLGEVVLVPALQSTVSWQRPVLSTGQVKWDWLGLPVQLEARVLVAGRMRGAVELHVPPAVLKPVTLGPRSGVTVGGGQVELQVRLQGELMNPSSIEGSVLAGGRQLQVGHKGSTVLAFDHGRLVADYRNGVLQVPDGRLVGETFSILGNGAVHHRGGVLGVVRVVADWEYAAAVSRAAAGMGFNRGTLPWLAPLGTPDRYYRDIHVEGTWPEAMVDVGRKGEQMAAREVVNRLTTFARGEKWEEDHGKGHDPRWDSLLLQQ